MGDNWATHAKVWADHGWEVHAIDQRNHGRSPQTTEHSYDAMSADLEAYMDDKGLSSAHILGHSMGGKTAMNFAVSRPNRVDSLMIIDIAPKSYPIHHQHFIDAMRSLNFSLLKSRTEVDEALALQVDNEGIRQFFLKSLYRKTRDEFAFRFNLDAIEANLDMVGEPLEFGYYNKPTLFIGGAMSGYILPEDHDRIHELFPEAEIISISNAGHWVHAEAREAFSEATLQFLAQQ
jgi:pimeloyl-ACP methyl ester carboxylesterase